MDLRLWNRKETPVLPLKGEWSFRWRPSLSEVTEERSVLQRIPSAWNRQSESARTIDSPYGYGIYTLKVLFPRSGPWIIRMANMDGAYRVYAGGKLLLSRGYFSEDPVLFRESKPAAYTPGFHPQGETEIRIEIANFNNDYGGGLSQAPEIGFGPDMEDFRNRSLALEVFLAGMLFIMGAYHFLLFLIQKRDWAVLLFSLVCFAALFRLLNTNERFLLSGLPSLTYFSVRMENIFAWLIPLTLNGYFAVLFSQGRLRALSLGLMAAGTAGTLTLILIPSTYWSWTIYALLAYALASILHIVVLVIQGFFRGDAEAGEVTLGTLFLVVPGILDLATTHLRLMNFQLFPLGLAPFLLINAYLLGKRYTRGAREAERLKVTNDELDHLVKERTRELEASAAEAQRRLRITEVYTRRSIVDVIEQGGDPTRFEPASKAISVLFSDIRDFTGLAEELKPIETVGLLNSYFTDMNESIQKCGGEIDKLIGDGIMALFMDSDQALRAGVAMRLKLREFNTCRKEGHRLDSGIGINYGEVVTGNIGSPGKMDYTVIGDIVNSASRIESLTKFYRLPLLISQDLKNNLTGSWALRFVDRVLLKGRRAPMNLFEVYDFEKDEVRRKKENWTALYAAAWEDYQAGRFSPALESYRELKSLLGPHEYRSGLCLDPVVDFYIDRCLLLMQREKLGILESWDGTWEFMEK